VPAALWRLLSREEVLVAAQLFDDLNARAGSEPREEWTPHEVCRAVPHLEEFPNLKSLLREDNTPLLAYVRFAKQPWHFREFTRMLCPTADARELDVFEQWRRERGKKARSSQQQFLGRPPSLSLPALPRPKFGAPLSSPASPAPLEACAPVVEETGGPAIASEHVEIEAAESESPEVPTPPPEYPASVTTTSAPKVRALRGLPDRSAQLHDPVEDITPPESASSQAFEAAVRQDQVKRYVQQRYLELMMVDGMEPNAACAVALREAPHVLAQGKWQIACRDSPTFGSQKLSARSVCA
jgi:hypothetical protein